MAIIARKPRNASLRMQTFVKTMDLTKKAPEKSLLSPLPHSGGRNSYGRITVRWRGGGVKRQYRIVDFMRTHKDIPGKIVAVEYDPNRNVPIVLVSYANGAKTYQLRPEGLTVGSTIVNSATADANVGNSLPLGSIPVGFFVHNVESVPDQGGKFARGAGTSVQLVAKENDRATLKMPSGELRTVGLKCWATVGTLANAEFRNMTIGKAGRNRHLGFKPSVRGMAMNPVDHPHGGGEGRSKSGSHPMTPWGRSCKGARTRKRKNTFIIRRRRP